MITPPLIDVGEMHQDSEIFSGLDFITLRERQFDQRLVTQDVKGMPSRKSDEVFRGIL